MSNLEAEQYRINFLINRDGIAETTRFVEQTISQYEKAMKDPKHPASNCYRAEYAESVCFLKHWLVHNLTEQSDGE